MPHTAQPQMMGIGNVILDKQLTLSQADIIKRVVSMGFAENSMNLINNNTANNIAGLFQWQSQSSGGSVANSMASVAALTRVFNGAAAARQVIFHGLASKDAAAQQFTQSFAESGGTAQLVYHQWEKPAADNNPAPTGQCFCFVNKDNGERTMLTNLGSNIFFHLKALDQIALAKSTMIFLEGYLFDSQESKDAFTQLVRQKNNGQKICLTLSDQFCVTRHGADFLQLINHGIDVVFANEAEIMALFHAPDFNQALAQAAQLAPLVVVTRSEKGVVLCGRNQPSLTIAAEPNIKVKDTTGAGDQLAAGVIYGLAEGWPLERSARLGCFLAAQIITRWGARLPIDHNMLSSFR
ncbi:MAG: adenosine kinase [Alphaproteobacteria bacterium]|nr:adenosine kinase [Alphaproteobacteria bacterium]